MLEINKKKIQNLFSRSLKKEKRILAQIQVEYMNLGKPDNLLDFYHANG